MDRPTDDAHETPGRADYSDIEAAPHAAVAPVGDLDHARRLIEDLENHGVPTPAIALLGATTDDRRQPDGEGEVAESGAFAQLAKSVILGGVAGMVIGALLGSLLAGLIPDLQTGWGLLIGGVFGAAVGGAAGGISVAKYSSRAWDETYQVEATAGLAVAVHHEERVVVDNAETIMQRHVGEVSRPDRDLS